MKTVEFLDAAKKKHALKSDYALAKKLNWSQSKISNYRAGRSAMDERACLEVAALLGLNGLEVMAEVNAERAKDSAVKAFWTQVAKSARAGMAAGLVLFMGSMLYGHPAPVEAQESAYYGKRRKSRRHARARQPLLTRQPDFFGFPAHARAA